MRSTFTLIGVIAASALFGSAAHAVALVTYEFQGQPGTQTTVAPASVATGLTALNFGESGLTPVSGANSINASGWTMSGAAYTFGFTVQSGYSVSIADLILSTRSSGTGPGFLSLQASVNGGAYTSVASFSQSGTTFNDQMLAITPLSGITSGVNFRIVAANQTSASGGAIGSSGTFRVGDYNPSGTPTPFTIDGTVQAIATAVPEPATAAILAAGLLGLARRRRRLT